MKTLVSVDVHFRWSAASATKLTVSPEEAFAILSMPAFAGFVSELVPNYGLPSVSEPENKD